MKRRAGQQGIAALPTMLVLGGLIVNIIIAITLGMYLLINSRFGNKLSAEALAAAKAGISDGILRVSRNKNFTTNSNGYTVTVGARSVNVVVCKDLPECGGVGHSKVTAIGLALNKKRKVETVLSVSPVGEVILESTQEVPL